MTIIEITTVVGMAIMLIGLIAGALGFRPTLSRSLSDSQERVNASQKTEIEGLTRQLAQASATISRMQREEATVRFALKKKGITLTKNGDYITLADSKTGTTHTTPLRPAWDAEEITQESKEDAS